MAEEEEKKQRRVHRPIVIWLLTGCFLIFLMVIIGGITRLTGSGLSITEWKPIIGAVPPLNEHDWQIVFEKYKQIPQYQKVNYDFTLHDFKSIYWWEYIHRLLGRVIGIVFIVPFVWFYAKKMMSRQTVRKVLFLFLLGALQGVIGWLMVKSGLTDRTSVSHIRLAIHLLTAFITFGFTFYFALELMKIRVEGEQSKHMHNYAWLLMFVVTVQIIYGAFVAGMHAGKIFNTFPLMNGKVFPSGMFALDPAWINFFDNQILVQFIHRLFAGIIVIMNIFLLMRMNKFNASTDLRNGLVAFTWAVAGQVTLGIFTLITSVNIFFALMHQLGAFVLFSICVYLLFVTRRREES